MKDKTGKECDGPGMDEGTQWAIFAQLPNLRVRVPVNLFLFYHNLPSVIFPVDFQSTSYIADNVCGTLSITLIP